MWTRYPIDELGVSYQQITPATSGCTVQQPFLLTFNQFLQDEVCLRQLADVSDSSQRREMTAKTCSVLLVLCGIISAALAVYCTYGWSTYLVGDTFPDTDGRHKCACFSDGVQCNEEPGICFGYGRWIKQGETFKDYIGIDKQSGFPRTDTCTCKHGEIICSWDTRPCSDYGHYLEHGMFRVYGYREIITSCFCNNSKLSCTKQNLPTPDPGSCLRNGSRINHGETFNDYVGVDKTSGFPRTDTCTCEHGNITCKWDTRPCSDFGHYLEHGKFRVYGETDTITSCFCNNTDLKCTKQNLPTPVPFFCYRNDSQMEHGKTFQKYVGVDKESGFPRTDTCTCKHGEIICRWEYGPCKYKDRYFRHGGKQIYATPYIRRTCICAHTQWTCTTENKPSYQSL